MKMKMAMKRSLRIAFALIGTMLISFGLFTTFAEAKTKYDMPTSVKVYRYKKGKWKKVNSYKIKYNSHGDPTKFDEGKIKYKYYKNKKIKQKTIYYENCYGKNVKTIYKYNEKGILLSKTNKKYWSEKPVEVNDKGWKTTYPEVFGYSGHLEFIYYKNGYPKKITAGKEYSLFNKKGLLTKSRYTVFGDVVTVSYKYKYGKGGRVKTINYKDKYDKFKVELGYTKAKRTTDKRKWSVLISSATTKETWGLQMGPFCEASQPAAVYSFSFLDE